MTVYSVPRLFIAGLGNLPYPNTRHSIGQLVVDALAERLGLRMRPTRDGFISTGEVFIGDTTVDLTLYKSSERHNLSSTKEINSEYHHATPFKEALMNISGRPIVAAFRQTACVEPSSMIVLTDSLSHRVTSLSVKLAGSANGHNGVKSIISALGGELGFYRFRLGIGRDQTDAADYVMQRLSSHEKQFWNNEGVDLVLNEIQRIAKKNAG
ncbi:peptidyl-tRNA hydrolase [Panaeolus papilionaceus]|nr:peptidyl-tRNA hydrolase [Panaeolus papilionaceus]